jgi:hypothetical protein
MPRTLDARFAIIACLTLLSGATSGPSVCEEAIVNPISGHAECVRPLGAPVDPPPPRPPVFNLAVFDFELEDVSAAGAAAPGVNAADLTRMQAVTGEARRVLAQSGRYILVDTDGVDAEPVKQRSLRSCDGCDAGIALKLGAERSLIGVVRRVAKTEYYVSLLITDTGTGRLVNEQAAFFTGADDAWASGVRLLIKHGVLADPNY